MEFFNSEIISRYDEAIIEVVIKKIKDTLFFLWKNNCNNF